VTWEFVDVLGRRLVAWGLLSVAAGVTALLASGGSGWWAGFGAMAVAWGGVNAAIGAAARVLAERNRRRTIGDQAARDRALGRVRAILLVNAALDVAYVALGAWLAATATHADPWRAGAGAGVVVQGAFLLVFDLLHARLAPPPGGLLPDGIDPFRGPSHDPFRLVRQDGAPEAGRPGALLVHGFSGSPREMRGLAAVLASSGWLVEVPRLPGHGAAIRDIGDYRLEDWRETVEAGAAALRGSGVSHMVVVGHSVGGALALVTEKSVSPDALVLLAPFWRPIPRWQRVVGQVLRIVLPPGFRIFGSMNLDDPDVRGAIGGFLPGVDLADPDAVARVREMRIPVATLEQLFRVSAAAVAGARTVRVPVLLVQGTADTVSLPDLTRRLASLLPASPSLLEVNTGHDLLTEASPARDEILTAVLAFASEIARPGPGPNNPATTGAGHGDARHVAGRLELERRNEA
jgi:carboxylesterase